MATNPMQRKTRNSFLLGVLVTLIICLLLGVLVYLLLLTPKEKEEMKTVAVLKTNIKAGDPITANSFTTKDVYASLVPANAINGNDISSKLKQLNSEKEDSEMKIVAAIDLSANTVLTAGQILESEVTDDTRYVEYNMLIIGTTIKQGSFVDIRITFPNGLDLIIASKKRVENIKGNTVGFYMNESEIDMMESAIVESYIMTASKMYLTQYVASTQKASNKTYVPTGEVRALISSNPNITEQAKNALESRFNNDVRSYENNARGAYSGEEITNLETKITKEIQDAKKAREEYLASVQSQSTANK